MKNLLKLSLLSLLIIMAISVTSCKKEEKDDPNITYFTYNETLNTNTTFPSTTLDTIDINKDGITDMLYGIVRYDIDTQYAGFELFNMAIAVNDTPLLGSNRFVKTFNKDQIPPLYNEATVNYIFTERFCVKYGTQDFGIAGKGDVYLAFGIKLSSTSDDIYYGWMRVNIPADYSSMKIIDGAISIIANKPIACGSK